MAIKVEKPPYGILNKEVICPHCNASLSFNSDDEQTTGNKYRYINCPSCGNKVVTQYQVQLPDGNIICGNIYTCRDTVI